MLNPFKKRASEYIHDEEAFLAVVSPEPLVTFVVPKAEQGTLYDRLVLIRGTPGSGKTTLATVFRYTTIATLLKNSGFQAHKPLHQALVDCRAVENEAAVVAACRLPMEAEYRDFWELPYADEVKARLLATILQARAVLGWFRDIEAVGHDLDEIAVVANPISDAALASIGGGHARGLLEKAKEVELAVYRIAAALVPPEIDEWPEPLTGAYRPFDVIEALAVTSAAGVVNVKPLVILDDAHSLHQEQLSRLTRWLSRRELSIARWVMTRLDVLSPADLFAGARDGDDLPGIDRAREVTEIRLQGEAGDRGRQRRTFRKLAKDMSQRYLRQMPTFSRRNFDSLSDFLETRPTPLPAGKLRELRAALDRKQKQLGIAPSRRGEIEEMVSTYATGSTSGDVGPEVQLQMMSILMSRYAGRTQASLFGLEDDPDPSRPLKVDASVAAGARIQLMHEHGRPFYFGIDDVCDAAWENAEQFLRLAADLVDVIELKLVRNQKPRSLDPATQNRLLREGGSRIVERWNFPQHKHVLRLADWLAKRCLDQTLAANAPLGAGANACGIPQDEFERLAAERPGLASALKFGLAYNAFSIVPKYPVKKRHWCLIELGGALVLKHGLPLTRGGFVETTADELGRVVGEVAAL